MKTEDLQDALGYVEEKLIEEVDALRLKDAGLNGTSKRSKKRAKGWYKWVAAAAVLCVIVVSVWRLPINSSAEDLMQGIVPQKVEPLEEMTAQNAAVTDFGIRLLQATLEEGENTLLSPLSVVSALAMTANGAEGETREQMEQVLGLTVEELNAYMYTYILKLPDEKFGQLQLANSIWFSDAETFQVEQDFLQTNADYYGADIYKRKFDKSAAEEINEWVAEKTYEMIPQIVDEISEETVMYLVNALAFEADWNRLYEEYQVREGTFTMESGAGKPVELMYGEEHNYLEDELATGFVKYYEGNRYAFVALLPKEGVSVAEYVNSLSGEGVQNLLNNASKEPVKTAIPKFETEYDAQLAQVLADMGMPDAFDVYNADFSGLGRDTRPDWNIYISKVLHKTYIEVGEKGTRAGAVTAVEMDTGGAAGPMEEPKEVILDRPFVYMIIDTSNHLPFFIGTLMDVE